MSSSRVRCCNTCTESSFGQVHGACMATDKQHMAMSPAGVGHAQARAYPQLAFMLISIGEEGLQVCKLHHEVNALLHQLLIGLCQASCMRSYCPAKAKAEEDYKLWPANKSDQHSPGARLQRDRQPEAKQEQQPVSDYPASI